MLAASFLGDLAQQVAALAALALALGVLSRLKLVRWLWRRNVSGPLGEWGEKRISGGAERFHAARVEPAIASIRSDIADIRKELKTNDGSTLRDAVQRTEATAERAEASANRAVGYAQRAAEAQGWPPGLDPTERPSPRPSSPPVS